MRIIIMLFSIAAIVFACNTKQGSNEPTVDNRANPAELPVDSIGANNDLKESAATDSNKTGDPHMPPGKSDLQIGSEANPNTAVSSDGNIVEKDRSQSSGSK